MTNAVTEKRVDNAIPAGVQLLFRERRCVVLRSDKAVVRFVFVVQRNLQRVPRIGLKSPDDFPSCSIANGKLIRRNTAFNSQRFQDTTAKIKAIRSCRVRIGDSAKVDRKVNLFSRLRMNTMLKNITKSIIGQN